MELDSWQIFQLSIGSNCGHEGPRLSTGEVAMRNQIRGFVFSAVIAFTTAFAFSGAPSVAHAQAATGAQAAPMDVKDCSKGCDIATCSNGWCTVWHCDANGCIQTGRYRQIPVGGNATPLADKPTALRQYDKFAYVKICSDSALCRVYELSPTKATSIGTTDNVDKMIRDYRASQST